MKLINFKTKEDKKCLSKDIFEMLKNEELKLEKERNNKFLEIINTPSPSNSWVSLDKIKETIKDKFSKELEYFKTHNNGVFIRRAYDGALDSIDINDKGLVIDSSLDYNIQTLVYSLEILNNQLYKDTIKEIYLKNSITTKHLFDLCKFKLISDKNSKNNESPPKKILLIILAKKNGYHHLM